MSLVEALAGWARQLDAHWLFLVILPIVVVLFGLWSRTLRRGNSAKGRREEC